jgi:hypothetical protein
MPIAFRTMSGLASSISRDSPSLERYERSLNRLRIQRSPLRPRESTRSSDDRESTLKEFKGHAMADQAIGSENHDTRQGLAHGSDHTGLAIISQMISITAPKPGKPKTNQIRNKR